MDIYDGTFESRKRLVFTNVRSGTNSVGPNGEQYFFRLTFGIESFNAHSLLVAITSDNGETWFPFQKLERQRLGR